MITEDVITDLGIMYMRINGKVLVLTMMGQITLIIIEIMTAVMIMTDSKFPVTDEYKVKNMICFIKFIVQNIHNIITDYVLNCVIYFVLYFTIDTKSFPTLMTLPQNFKKHILSLGY